VIVLVETRPYNKDVDRTRAKRESNLEKQSSINLLLRGYKEGIDLTVRGREFERVRGKSKR